MDRTQNNKQISDIDLQRFIHHYNCDHALKFTLHINEGGYNVITIVFPPKNGPETQKLIELEPMTNVEAYYFIKGFKFLRDNPA